MSSERSSLKNSVKSGSAILSSMKLDGTKEEGALELLESQ